MTGLEPAASALTGQRSNQLSYTPRECEPNEEEYTSIGLLVSRGAATYLGGREQHQCFPEGTRDRGLERRRQDG